MGLDADRTDDDNVGDDMEGLGLILFSRLTSSADGVEGVEEEDDAE